MKNDRNYHDESRKNFIEEESLTFINNDERKSFKVLPDQNLYQLLDHHGIYVENSCGGNKICGKCKVKISEGMPEITAEESKVLTHRELERGIRLACCVEARGDLVVALENKALKGQILGLEANLDSPVRPRAKWLSMDWKPGTIMDQRDPVTRIKEALPNLDLKIPLAVLREISALASLDSFRPLGMMLYENREILSMTTESNYYGIAVDLGTTTIAATLINLTDGNPLATATSLNPQKRYGGDVISRIHYTMHERNGIDKLQSCVIEEINAMIIQLCDEVGIGSSSVYEMTVAGNTTMLHMLLGVPCESIAASPFIPGFTAALKEKAKELGLKIHPEGYVVTLPAVSAYIGGDTTGAIQSTRLFESKEICLLIDIGTNGEIVLGNREGMVACSAAAGPAFEGASIRYGIGGIEGAIDHVVFETKEIYTTIGGKAPIGICGSGIIDVISELKRSDIVDGTGRFRARDELENRKVRQDICERVVIAEGKPAFMLDFENEIYLEQRDIREIQLAKSAIRAGIEILIQYAGISYEAIAKVFIAGGFGNYMNIESAVNIGLIPEVLKDKCILADNAALKGAALMLMDSEVAPRMSEMLNGIECIELSCAPEFQELFIEHMTL